VITFGGLIVSKKIKAFLRDYRPQYHWHLDKHKALDTFFNLTDHFKVVPNEFFEKLMPYQIKKESSYREYWMGVRNRYVDKRKQYLKDIPYSDMKVFQHIMNKIPNHYQLQLGNSSTVR